jgi:uncharacterized protein (TIGR03086 family)
MDMFAQLDAVIPTLGDLVKATRPDQLESPTPCASFTVRDLLGHFVGNIDSVASGLRGESMPETLAPRPEMLGDDPGIVYDKVMSDLLAAAREPGALDRVLRVPFVAFDLIMHSWDLATATGQQYSPPDELVAAADAFARQAIAPEWRDGDTFAAEVEPAASATPLERLVAFSGRQA